MSETNEIVAKVTEEPQVKRPTLYAYLKNDNRPPFLSGAFTKPWEEDDGWLRITIPGELESAQAARIEQSRGAVIQAAKEVADSVFSGPSNKLRAPSIGLATDLNNALDALTLATQENAK